VEPRLRLHPLSPLLHSAKYLAVVIAAISIQGAARLGWRGFIGTVVVATCVVVAYAAITWLVTGYHVVGRELRTYDGLLVRRTRAIPLERLQSVEVIRPLLARLTGLAELRLEVVGGGKTEAPLAYLTVSDAMALRHRLLALAVRAGAPAATTPPGPAGPAGPTPGPLPPGHPVAPGPPLPDGLEPDLAGSAAGAPAATPMLAERPLHTVVNRDVLISQFLTPQVMFLPFLVALVVAQSWFEAGAWSLVVLASMAVAVIGVIRQPVRRVMSDWNFRLALQEPPPGRHHPGLRVRHGLTETRSQTVPLNRVQAIGVTWPLLWRRRRWLRCQLDVAGFTRGELGDASSDRLLPVGDLATGRRLTAEALPGVDLAELRLATPPRRARWLAPLRQPVLGAALTDQVFATRDGRITRELVVVPYLRMQSVRVVQGPVQRRLRLASVYADTAGSLTAVAHHRDLAEARQLAAELTCRARAAREADHPGGPAADQPPADQPAPPPADQKAPPPVDPEVPSPADHPGGPPTIARPAPPPGT
jgi:putative membrane protein